MKRFLVEVSARHVHLNRKAVEILFGKDYSLTVRKNLSQTGQYVCNERILVVGPKGEIKNVSVLGPEREKTQVEISKTDARSMGILAPVKESGDLKGSPGCRLVGPKGELELEEGVIVAKRHIHANFEDAKELGVKDGEIVFVDIPSKDRSLIFKDVVVRVSEDFVLAMHIDTDEANAADLAPEVMGKILKI